MTPWLIAMSLIAALASTAYADRAQAKEWFDKASRLHASGQKTQALALYERAIAEDADYTAAYERAARLWISERSFERAIRHLERFTLRHPNRAFAWYTLAYAYRRTKRYEYAALAYEMYIDLRPREATPYFGLGMARLRLHDPNGARAAFERYIAMERDPARQAFVEQARRELHTLVKTAEKASQQTDAQSRRQAAKRTTFDQHMMHLERMLATRRYASAQTLAERMKPTNHYQAVALDMLRAQIFIARGLFDKARQTLWSVLAAAPSNVDAYLILRRLR